MFQRYDHMQGVCEILPAGIPSLVLCLQALINYDKPDSVIYKKTKEITKCNYEKSQTGFIMNPVSVLSSHLDYSIENIGNLYQCEFPGSKIYNWLLSVKLISQFFLDRHKRYSEILNTYNLKNKFFNTMIFEEVKQFYPNFKEKFKSLELAGQKELDKFFYYDLVEELRNLHLQAYIDIIDEKISQLNQISIPDYAPIRPLN